MSFVDGRMRVDFVLFGSIVVSAKINEFPMMLGAIVCVGFDNEKKNTLKIFYIRMASQKMLFYF